MQKAIEILTSGEVATLLAHIQSDRMRDHEILFELKLVTGLRTREICTLPMGAFNVATGELHVNNPAKGSNKGIYDLNTGGLAARLGKVLDKHRMVLFQDDPMIWCFTPSRSRHETSKQWINRQWQSLRRKLYGDGFKLGLHALRHTFAQNVRQIADVEGVQQMLRHKSLHSTQQYLARPTKEQGIILHIEASARLYGIDKGEEQ